MNKIQIKNEVAKMKSIKDGKYMIGTKAYHQLGELSRGEDLFVAQYETDEYFIGMWITGFGYFNVCFPKETSRELTNEEVKEWSKKYIQIGSQPPVKLNLKK